MHFADFDATKLENQLSGERFAVTYLLSGTEQECRTMAEEICVEQSIEFPVEATPEGAIRDQIVGQILSLTKKQERQWEAVISFCVESAGQELTQFLNVLFGNFSIKEHVQVAAIDFSPQLFSFLHGPRFGIAGIRKLLAEPEKPLLMTALKPMGLSAQDFGKLIYTFAENGMQIVKDDHGLANQPFAPFRERVRSCCDAVKAAYEKTGNRCLYVPNVTAPFMELQERARFAKSCGAGGVMVAPGLVGFDAMQALSQDPEIDLPIFSHPAFSGSFAVHPDQGFTIPLFYGTLMRMAGADAVIFPNYGGRFSFTKEECVGIAQAGKAPIGDWKSMFVCPAGGMQLDRIADMQAAYGQDILFLIGGGLFTSGPDLQANCRAFVQAVQTK